MYHSMLSQNLNELYFLPYRQHLEILTYTSVGDISFWWELFAMRYDIGLFSETDQAGLPVIERSHYARRRETECDMF